MAAGAVAGVAGTLTGDAVSAITAVSGRTFRDSNGSAGVLTVVAGRPASLVSGVALTAVAAGAGETGTGAAGAAATFGEGFGRGLAAAAGAAGVSAGAGEEVSSPVRTSGADDGTTGLRPAAATSNCSAAERVR